MSSMYKGECSECGKEVSYFKTSREGPDPDAYCSKVCETNHEYKKKRGLEK